MPTLSHHLAAGLLLCSLASPTAQACPNYDSMYSIFFRDFPGKLHPPFAAKVTVMELLETPNLGRMHPHWVGRVSYRGIARVDHLIRGSQSPKLIRLNVPASDCGVPFAVGDSGIVAGKLRTSEDGDFELVAETHRAMEFR